MAKVLKSRTTIDFFYLLTSSLLGQGLRMVRSFIVAGIIGPLMFGTIQGLGIFLLYVPLIQLGYFQSMSRELPKRLQAGDRDTVRRINNNGLFMAILAGLIGLLVYMAIFAVQGPSMSGPSRIAWLLFAGMVALGPVTLFYQMIYSAYGKFVTVSKIKIVYSVVFFLLLGLVLVWGYVGPLLSLVLAAVLLVATHVRVVLVLPPVPLGLYLGKASPESVRFSYQGPPRAHWPPPVMGCEDSMLSDTDAAVWRPGPSSTSGWMVTLTNSALTPYWIPTNSRMSSSSNVILYIILDHPA